MKLEKEIKLGEVILELVNNDPRLNVARLADEIGTNRSSLQNIVHKGSIPKGLVTLLRISRKFDLSLDELVFGKSLDSSPQSSLSFSEKSEQVVRVTGKIQIVVDTNEDCQ